MTTINDLGPILTQQLYRRLDNIEQMAAEVRQGKRTLESFARYAAIQCSRVSTIEFVSRATKD